MSKPEAGAYRPQKIQIDARIRAIAEDIATGQTIGMTEKYMELYNLKKTRINEYIREAKPLALQMQQELMTKQQEMMAQEATEALQMKVITKLERMKLLSDIIQGRTTVTIKRPVWNGEERKMQIVTVETAPDFRERMKAIEVLNAMDGSNAPVKSDIRIRAAAEHRVTFKNYSRTNEQPGITGGV